MRCRGIVVVLAAMASVAARAMPPVQFAPPPLGNAASFVVLGGTSVVNTGDSCLTGNVGVSPGNAVSGFTSSMFKVGDVYRNDALARAARTDANAADAILATRRCTTTSTDAEIRGGTFSPGVHCFTASEVQLTGTLILDAGGDRDAAWLLRFDGTFTTADDAKVLVIGNGYDGNAFWRSVGATTIGARTTFIGNIFASSIAFQNGARLSGRALARTGAVTTNANCLLLCCAPITVASPPLPEGTVDVSYPKQSFTASGGVPPYRFRVSSGSLPDGLKLADDGTLTGTPSRPGKSKFTITATDSLGCEGTRADEISVAPPECPLAFTDPDPLRGKACEPYNHSFSAACAVAPYKFTAPDDKLPPGITLSGDGTLSGKTSFALTYPVPVTLTDASRSVTRVFTLAFDCPQSPGTTIPLRCATVGVDYKEKLPDFTCSKPGVFSEVTKPPADLHVSESGVVYGTPLELGSHSFTVAYKSVDGCVVERDVTIEIVCPDMMSLSDLPPMALNVPYDQTLTVNNGPAGSYTVTITGLPTDVDNTRLHIYGTPSVPGPYNISVTATHDLSGCNVSRDYDLNCPVLEISPNTLPDGCDDLPYPDVAFSVAGGTPPYLFVVSAGSLPPGLDLSTDGLLSGTTTTCGTFDFEITVTDKYGCTGTRAYSITVFCGADCPEGVPALSGWGVLLFTILLAGAGVIVMRRM